MLTTHVGSEDDPPANRRMATYRSPMQGVSYGRNLTSELLAPPPQLTGANFPPCRSGTTTHPSLNRARRRSGTWYSTPVTLVETGGQRWLVAPYGAVSWVRNARAAGQVTLSRGCHVDTGAIVELGPAEAAPVLKQYVTAVPITRPFFDAKPDAPLEAFVAEAPRHPVFHIHGESA